MIISSFYVIIICTLLSRVQLTAMCLRVSFIILQLEKVFIILTGKNTLRDHADSREQLLDRLQIL